MCTCMYIDDRSGKSTKSHLNRTLMYSAVSLHGRYLNSAGVCVYRPFKKCTKLSGVYLEADGNASELYELFAIFEKYVIAFC